MADEFTLESRTANAVKVRHVEHGHRYTFIVRERSGWRLLWTGQFLGNTYAPLPAMVFRDAARAFAEGDARKAGLID
jgi:hypothetical protein